MRFVVYLTMYTGDKLPKWYIGSTNKNKIEKGYNGSVASKMWLEKYKKEQKENRHLFKTRILSYHNTREEALNEEYRVQQIHKSPYNEKYINRAYATSFIGGDNSEYIDYSKGRDNISKALIAANIKKYGEFKDFKVICNKCQVSFIVNEREFKHPMKEKYFCNRSCANSKSHSDETKRKQREATLNNKSYLNFIGTTDHKNTKFVTKDGKTKRIKIEQTDSFLSDGWVFGRSKEQLTLN